MTFVRVTTANVTHSSVEGCVSQPEVRQHRNDWTSMNNHEAHLPTTSKSVQADPRLIT
jgi:hypothetical protein